MKHTKEQYTGEPKRTVQEPMNIVRKKQDKATDNGKPIDSIMEESIVEDRRTQKSETLGSRIEEKLVEGSITVEAAFVMPIVIMTIFALMYLTFYLHDICRIQGVVDLTMHKAGLAIKHEADIATGEIIYEDINDRGVFYPLLGAAGEEEAIKKLLIKELSKGLFLVKADSIKVRIDKQRVRISVATDTTLTLMGLTHIFQAIPDKTIIGEYPVHNPAETVRCFEVILETGSKIKGVDELKERLNTVIGSNN